MLLALIIFQLSVLVAANPFHKYPFVFLLDVGNEELEKTNSEQIRLSVPGGSVALRYPAIGDGNTIGHIRVSGIDFGTDLKANIVDGGPGYKYVVLVFMGNLGVPYDAVVTVQTVTDRTANIQTTGSDDQIEDDANNSAEDISDESVNGNSQNEIYVQSTNAELMQSSSNVYNYAENEVIDQSDNTGEGIRKADNNDNDESNIDDEYGISIDNTENESSQKNTYEQYSEDVSESDDPDVQIKGIDTVDEEDDDNEGEINSNFEQYVPKAYAQDNEPISVVGSSIYSNSDSKPHLIGGEVYYQDDEHKRPDNQQEPLDYEDPDELQPIFNDGEVHN